MRRIRAHDSSETGQSPTKAVENLHVEAARLMMEQSRHPIDIVARQTGFGIAMWIC